MAGDKVTEYAKSKRRTMTAHGADFLFLCRSYGGVEVPKGRLDTCRLHAVLHTDFVESFTNP